MSHRRENVYHERLVEHLQEREWSQVQIINLTHKIGHSALLSCESVLNILEYQQEIDEQIAAEKEYDRWAISREFTGQIPEDFFEGYDSEGRYINPGEC